MNFRHMGASKNRPFHRGRLLDRAKGMEKLGGASECLRLARPRKLQLTQEREQRCACTISAE